MNILIHCLKYKIEDLKRSFCIWFARKFPYVAIWCFLVVLGENGESPRKEFKEIYDFWKNKYRLKDM